MENQNFEIIDELSEFLLFDFPENSEDLNLTNETTLSAIEDENFDFEFDQKIVEIEAEILNFDDNNSRNQICVVCDQKFANLPNLKRHFGSKKHQEKLTAAARTPELLQTGEFSFAVNYVMQMEEENFEIEFSNKTGRKIHESRKNQKITNDKGRKLFRCKFCPKIFTTASNLNRHENLHDKKKLHECQTCSKKFQQKEYLKKHQIVHERQK